MKKTLIILCLIALSSTAMAVRDRPHLDDTLGYNVLLSDNNTLLRGVSLSWDGGDPYGSQTKVMPTQNQLNALRDDYGLNTVHLYLEGDSSTNPNDPNTNADDCDILVQRCADAELYLIITIGCNGENGYNASKGYAIDMTWSTAFWNYYGPRYKDETHVIYEAHNEPAMYTPNQWVLSDWNNQITFYNTIRSKAPETFILLGSFMGFAGDVRWGENYLSTNGVSWSNAGFAYHGYESLSGIEANIDRMSANTSYPALLCTEFGKEETVNSDYNSMCESHYNGWMQFMWLGADDWDMQDFQHKIDAAGTIWTPDDPTCNWPTKGTLNIPGSSTPVGLYDRGEGNFVNTTASDNLKADQAAYANSTDDTFIIEDLGTMGLVALKRASDGKYVRATSETDSLTVNTTSVGKYDKFQFMRLDIDSADSGYEGDIALRAYGGGGHLVRSSADGNTLVPDGDSATILDSKYVMWTDTSAVPDPITGPYNGILLTIPGVIEAEDFDYGGETLAYSDWYAGNGLGAYRPDEDVDIEYNSGNYSIGQIENGEWLRYTVNVEETAEYLLEVFVASQVGYTGKSFHVMFDGEDKTGTMTLLNPAGWYTWRSVSKVVSLEAGIQYMQFVSEAGQFNLNKFTLTRLGGEGDVDNDEKVDNIDLVVLAQNWQQTSCGTCQGADLTGDNAVTISDLKLVAENWLNDYTLMVHLTLDGNADNSSYYTSIDGTVYGSPTWDATGNIGRSMVFDGINDYVNINSYNGVAGTTSRTASTWIKTTVANVSAFLFWGDFNVTGGAWVIHTDTSGAVRVSVAGGNQVGTIAINDGGWHHVAFVLEDDGSPSTDEIKIYVDGVEDTAAVGSSQAIDTVGTNNVMIGRSVGVGTIPTYFTGQLDDVRIYSRALGAAEIQALHAMGN